MNIMKPIIAVVALSIFGLGISYFTRESKTITSTTRAEPTATAVNEVSPEQKGTEIHCKVASEPMEIHLCDLLLKGQDDQFILDTFKVTFAEYDLNAEAPSEIIAWESSWAGTSGGILWVLEMDRKESYRIQTEFDFTCWSPVSVLLRRNKGWRDISVVQAGGGVKTEVFKVRFDGKKYKPVDEPFDEEAGEVVIGKSWSPSVFGPRLN